MSALPMNQIAISVSDLQHSHRWYRDIFGYQESGGTYMFITETIVAAEQPYRLEYKAKGAPLQWKYHGFVTLEPTSGGGTTITWEAQFRSPVPGSGMITSATLRSLAKGLAGEAEKAC